MKLITNIQAPFLSDIIFEKSKNFETIKAAVAYCKNYELFEYCKQHGIKVDYYARLDDSINLDLEKLKSFLTDNISISIIGGSKFHPKVIWCYDYGAYIGSANLTSSAWEENIECGLWLTQKELEDHHLGNSLENFFKSIQQESKPLNNISNQDVLKLSKYKQDMLELNEQNSSLRSGALLITKNSFGIFYGYSSGKSSNTEDLNSNSSYKEESSWNDLNEMRSLLIFKKLEREGFPRRRQAELCRQMANIPNIDLFENNISAKVGNYKSVARTNNPSNYSTNTESIYKKYKDTSVKQLERIIENFFFF